MKFIIDIQPNSLCFVATLTTFRMLYFASFFRSLLSYSVTLEFQTELFIQCTEIDCSPSVSLWHYAPVLFTFDLLVHFLIETRLYNLSARANSGIELTTSRKVDIFQPIIDSVSFGVSIAIELLSRYRKVKLHNNSSFKQFYQELKIDLNFFLPYDRPYPEGKQYIKKQNRIIKNLEYTYSSLSCQ